jgi:hypothetical protein
MGQSIRTEATSPIEGEGRDEEAALTGRVVPAGRMVIGGLSRRHELRQPCWTDHDEEVA